MDGTTGEACRSVGASGSRGYEWRAIRPRRGRRRLGRRGRRRRPGRGPCRSRVSAGADRERGECGGRRRRPGAARRRGRGRRRARRSGCSRSRGRRRWSGARRGSRPVRRRRRRGRRGSSEWPPVTTTAFGPSSRTARARSSWRSVLVEAREHPRLGDVRRRDRDQRQQVVDQRVDRVFVEQPGARLGDHHRIEHDRGVADEAERLDHGGDRRRVAEHPDLHRVDADVLGDRANLGDDHLRRHHLDRLDPDRVLRRDRGDRRHPVHAAARERLQIGLDPGAAARVRAGDREHRGYDFLAIAGA